MVGDRGLIVGNSSSPDTSGVTNVHGVVAVVHRLEPSAGTAC